MNNTINYYNKISKEYIDSTFDCNMTNIYDLFLNYVKPKSKIIDLGFGSGRDSIYFISKGFDVLSVDPVLEFINRGKELGLKTILGTIGDVKENNYYDGIFACASLLHVNETDLYNTFIEISNKLVKDGILYCSFKYGDFSGDRNGRYFIDLNEKSIDKYLPNNLDIIKIIVTEDVRDNNSTKWLNLVMKKV